MIKPQNMFALVVAVALIVPHAALEAVTVWYQPTPYPKKTVNNIDIPWDTHHIWDGWINDHFYGLKFQEDDRLQVGGWGDEYRTYVKFDTTGLPQNVTTAGLFLWPYSLSNPPSVDFYQINGWWDLNMVWGSQPAATWLGTRSAPAANQWWGTNVTTWYNQWRANPSSNFGLRLDPTVASNNNFDLFRSSRYTYAADGLRPALQLTFTPPIAVPDFKMPLPNVNWLLTEELGGWDCKGDTPWPDIYHQDSTGNYYALDFSPSNRDSNGNTVYLSDNVPILAAANGRVVAVNKTNPNDPNGYYVVIDHDYDNNVNTGFTTRYLHLKNPPLVDLNENVVRGKKLGLMGGTGGYPVHLHFGARYNNSGLSTRSELSYFVMDSRIMKSYQTECSMDTNGKAINVIRYYPSTNITVN